MSEDAQIGTPHPSPGESELPKRWRDLRELLILQLAAFEAGGLTLHSGAEDVSEAAVSDLRRKILEFDALISEAAGANVHSVGKAP